jgi:hypothetical protein
VGGADEQLPIEGEGVSHGRTNPRIEHSTTEENTEAESEKPSAFLGAEANLVEMIRNDLSKRGFDVDNELIENAVSDYNGRGNYEDIADFIEDEYLSEEIEHTQDIEGELSNLDNQEQQTEFIEADEIPAQNYNAFMLAFPQIADGTHQSMTFKNSDKKELDVYHSTTSAGTVHIEISYFGTERPGHRTFDPSFKLEVDFENRTLKPISYHNDRTGEDVNVLSIPLEFQSLSAAEIEKIYDDLALKLNDFFVNVKEQDFELIETEVFHDEQGNPLPAEPKEQLALFLNESAERESDAHGYIQGIKPPKPPYTRFQNVKEDYPEHLAFVQLGEFYESFSDDAKTVCDISGFTLTSRTHDGVSVPMCGFPAHALEKHVENLMTKGFNVVTAKTNGEIKEWNKTVELTAPTVESLENQEQTSLLQSETTPEIPMPAIPVPASTQNQQLSLWGDEPLEMSLDEQIIKAELLHGTGVEDGKFDIEEFAKTNPTNSEFANYLREKYGWGGCSGRVIHELCGNSNHDSKGIHLTVIDENAPDGKRDIHLNYNNVAKRIDELIRNNEYITENDIKQRIETAIYRWNNYNHDLESADRIYIERVEKVFELYGIDKPETKQETNLDVQELPEPIETQGILLTQPVINKFTDSKTLLYARNEDGVLFISNGSFIMRAAENDINVIAEQINARRTRNIIEPQENERLLTAIDKVKGNFELTENPYVLTSDIRKSYVYADDKQYFEYDKGLIEVFQFTDSRMFVDDNSSYNIRSHNLIIKDQNGEVLGLVMPLRIDERLYEKLADELPLEIPWKNELERARENADNDPYIGKEYFDGKETHIVTGITERDGVQMYTIPTIEDGKILRYALLLLPEDMENRIKLWETQRIDSEKQKIAQAESEKIEAAAQAEYEDTNGFADNMPPMQKANVLRVLNENFHTKDYGLLKNKHFIETALKNGKRVETADILKKKYQSGEYELHDYLSEYVHNGLENAKVRKALVSVTSDGDMNSEYAVFLKNNHPYVHYMAFRDESVLPDNYFSTEYRLITGETEYGGEIFYTINKTAHDYGRYLIDNGILEIQQAAELPEPEVTESDLSDIIAEIETETTPDIQDLPDLPKPKANNFRITNDNLGHGGAKEKFNNNIEAIKLMKQLEKEASRAYISQHNPAVTIERYGIPTPEEQEILSKYVGWGGLSQAFDKKNEAWSKEYETLDDLLSVPEYEDARASTMNAHYTSPTVIRAMYETLNKMGFKGGNILEPAMGVGNFFGMLPENMAEKSKLYGAELDFITGRIAKLLYPQAEIWNKGYEKNTTYQDNFFDVAVGNVPFGGLKIADKRYDKLNLNIHDYFFAKSIDKVRPGGVVAFITSKGTLDKQDNKFRKYLAERTELLGAIRLPNNAFKANAGTEVTSDIIFLQKRDSLVNDIPHWVNLGKTEDGLPINNFFAVNPDMVLGKMVNAVICYKFFKAFS